MVKGTEFAIGAAWDTQFDAQRVADSLESKYGQEYEVVFQEES
jgi:hypothetical protein